MAAPSAASEPVRGMRVVAEQYEKLEHVVGSLNSKTRDLLLRERKEFLAAYRAHSFRIQDELQELRAKVQAEQSSSRKDEKGFESSSRLYACEHDHSNNTNILIGKALQLETRSN